MTPTFRLRQGTLNEARNASRDLRAVTSRVALKFGLATLIFVPVFAARAAPVTRDVLVNGDFAAGLSAWEVSASDVKVEGGAVTFHDGDDAADLACLSQTVHGLSEGDRLSFSVDLASNETRPGWWRFVSIRLKDESDGSFLADRIESVGQGEDSAKRTRVLATATSKGDVTVAMCISDNEPSAVRVSHARLLVTGSGDSARRPLDLYEDSGICPKDFAIESTQERDGDFLVVRESLHSIALKDHAYASQKFSEKDGHDFAFKMKDASANCQARFQDSLGSVKGLIRDGLVTFHLDPLGAAEGARDKARVSLVNIENGLALWEFQIPLTP